MQFARIDGVVLDSVAGTDHLGALQTGDGGHHRLLHVDRHAGGHAVDVDFIGVQALGLEEDLVAGLIRELDDLVLDGRAVARTDALDLTAI